MSAPIPLPPFIAQVVQEALDANPSRVHAYDVCVLAEDARRRLTEAWYPAIPKPWTLRNLVERAMAERDQAAPDESDEPEAEEISIAWPGEFPWTLEDIVSGAWRQGLKVEDTADPATLAAGRAM